MAAVIGQRLPKLTKTTLTKFRTDESLDHFYADVACKSEGLLSEPTLPRKRRTLVRLEFRDASYREDVDTGALPEQLSILEVMLKEEKISCFNEILLAVLKFPEPEKRLIQEVQTICKLLAVNPVTSAADERSLSSARGLKTSLRSKMRDERSSNLAVLPEWSQAENRQCLYS
ncbi:unnamed protein product [Porites lobata]|uniref:Uncharacterized protein n=1 Tax=Porites lobata TaxID=104759 RepID=A0ABN8NMU7_9CNID|nr:unnamed protein product [Porites lobata]